MFYANNIYIIKERILFMNKKNNDKMDRQLENAFFNNPVASTNDCTGYVNTIPEEKPEAKNISELLNVPVESIRKKKRK